MPSSLGAVDLSRLFLPQFIGYFDKAEAMPFSYSPQIAYNTVKIVKKRGPLGSIQCFYYGVMSFSLSRLSFIAQALY
ncbi:hypothetical protein swp_1333 [Shewanella piezotolerans WP3]|uniref:Uncharacterized protein n=1 Tax=Shewanella piezotolerans (strain WP3 / JCM 13877) TaxID=225849 RepID=B8CJM3_SHEPW|nr:hypothetical protein swp_1333 [Shewanella piezotolerans WP3]